MSDNIKNNFEKQLFALTTIIETEFEVNKKCYRSQGSGFYYQESVPTDPNNKGMQWHCINGYWLVTNRHVVLPKIEETGDLEYLPQQLTFCLRQIVNGKIEWIHIVLGQKELLEKLKLHSNPNVDVALIDVSDYVLRYYKDEQYKKELPNIMLPSALSTINLPEGNALSIDVTSDVIVASYPKGFYDKYNKFPIVKSGIVASAWGFHFNNQPLFQIDSQLFPGSSGGLVISKPTNIAFINGKICYSAKKEFVFLGIYSGEYLWNENITTEGNKSITLKHSYGLGNVWYSYLVTEIIEKGIKFRN